MTMPPSGQRPLRPQGPPQYWGPPPPSPKDGGKTKWVLRGLGILVVVVISVVTTLLVTRVDSAVPNHTPTPIPSTTPDKPDVASADDRGPVALITDDPTCPAWTPISDTMIGRLPQGWKDRDSSIPSSFWTPTLRADYKAAAAAMRAAAEQTVSLATRTPHRVMRELYEQAIAYWREYADALEEYTPADNYLANSSTAASNALVWICAAVSSGSAASRSPLVIPGISPSNFAPVEDPARPKRFLTKPSPACAEWGDTAQQFDSVSSDWLETNPNIPASQWPPAQQKIYTEMIAPMSSNANKLQDIAIRSNNPVFGDFADLAAVYRRAYVQSFATYVPADGYLAQTASQAVVLVNMACLAAQN